ncbi:MAG: hypothetical protein KKD44_29310 [Proteobacteria bacterium]|nr:hypothetical protein [Pseudomonadota bacterium]
MKMQLNFNKNLEVTHEGRNVNLIISIREKDGKEKVLTSIILTPTEIAALKAII